MLMKYFCFGVEIDFEWEFLLFVVCVFMFQCMMGVEFLFFNGILEWFNERGFDIFLVNF